MTSTNLFDRLEELCEPETDKSADEEEKKEEEEELDLYYDLGGSSCGEGSPQLEFYLVDEIIWQTEDGESAEQVLQEGESAEQVLLEIEMMEGELRVMRGDAEQALLELAAMRDASVESGEGEIDGGGDGGEIDDSDEVGEEDGCGLCPEESEESESQESVSEGDWGALLSEVKFIINPDFEWKEDSDEMLSDADSLCDSDCSTMEWSGDDTRELPTECSCCEELTTDCKDGVCKDCEKECKNGEESCEDDKESCEEEEEKSCEDDKEGSCEDDKEESCEEEEEESCEEEEENSDDGMEIHRQIPITLIPQLIDIDDNFEKTVIGRGDDSDGVEYWLGEFMRVCRWASQFDRMHLMSHYCSQLATDDRYVLHFLMFVKHCEEENSRKSLLMWFRIVCEALREGGAIKLAEVYHYLVRDNVTDFTFTAMIDLLSKRFPALFKNFPTVLGMPAV